MLIKLFISLIILNQIQAAKQIERQTVLRNLQEKNFRQNKYQNQGKKRQQNLI